MSTTIICPVCKSASQKKTGAVNRARKNGAPIYCGRECAGIARRSTKTKAQRRAEKAEYDKKYREANRERLKAQKAAYFQKTYDPQKAAIERAKVKKTKPEIEARRREYMRSDGYRARKKKYDRQYVAASRYGPEWGECMVIALEIRDACLSLMSDTEIRTQAGTNGKSQKRKRDYERLNSKEPKAGPLEDIK